MSTLSEVCFKAATGPAPKNIHGFRWTVAWVGDDRIAMQVSAWRHTGVEVFFAADEDHQRTFLLLIAEATR